MRAIRPRSHSISRRRRRALWKGRIMLQKSFRFVTAALLLCFIGGVARSQSTPGPTVYADSIAAVAGVEFAVQVGGFTDGYAFFTDYSVSIDWGDGQTSSGLLSEYNFPVFDVGGIHTYAKPGSYVTKITVTDADGLSGSSSGSAVVSPVDPPLTATGLNIQSGKSFSGVVATFTDTNPSYPAASDFTATIQWGDGHSSTGAIAGAGGGFSVSGSHTYRKPGIYAVTVTIKDVGGSTAIARTTINVKK